jgi:hypothetical protein
MTDAAGPLGWINYWKPKDEWHYLPAERRAALLAAWDAIRGEAVAAGARRFGTYECRASAAWARVSLWEFPDLATLTRMVDALSDAAYYQYFAEENAFGRRTEDPYANYMAAADATESFLEGA